MEQSVRDWYSEDEVEVWLVNPDDSLDNAFSFVGDAGVQLPVLLDLGGTNYFAYPRDVELPFGPFPVQVVIGPDGVIRSDTSRRTTFRKNRSPKAFWACWRTLAGCTPTRTSRTLQSSWH